MAFKPFSPSPRAGRWCGCAGLAGAVAGCAVLAALVIVFGEASDMDWLAPTPEDIDALRPCIERAGTAARRACVETVIAQVRADHAARQLACLERGAGEPAATQ